MKKRIHYVYKITNNLSGKFYIGKHSIQEGRKRDRYFGSGLALKQAIEKYGRENFTKEVIMYCETAQEALDLEYSLIKDLVNNTMCYNLVGGGLLHREVSKETRAKISKSSMGKKGTMKDKEWSNESKQNLSLTNHKNKSVYQYTMNWEFVKEYRNVATAGRETGFNRHSIGLCASGKIRKSGRSYYKQTGGFRWTYKKI